MEWRARAAALDAASGGCSATSPLALQWCRRGAQGTHRDTESTSGLILLLLLLSRTEVHQWECIYIPSSTYIHPSSSWAQIFVCPVAAPGSLSLSWESLGGS